MKYVKDIRERLKNYNRIDSCVVPDFPSNMLIELSNICNHECVFCANSKMTRQKGEIDREFLYRILKEASNLGVTDVGFYATGEPFVSMNLVDYIRAAKEIGYKYVYLTTNGALVSPERTKQVLEAGLDSIKFSINAGTRETYNFIHGRDDFNRVISNLIGMDKYRKSKKNNIKLYVSYVVTKQNEAEKEILKELIEDIVDDIIFIEARNQGGLMYEINDYLVLENKKYNIKNPPCSLLFNSLHITYEGYLTACCVDFQNYLVVGNLNELSLENAWESREFMKLREMHLNNKLEGTLCYNCLYNKNVEIEPFLTEYATYFEYSNFNKEEYIKNRLESYIDKGKIR